MHEIKSAPQHIKAIDDREVTGIFSVSGNTDSYGDVLMPGAFTKTFTERANKIYHLWQHDFSSPPTAIVKSLREIGREELPREILTRFPNALGGAEVVREYLSTPRADEVLTNLKAGSPLEMSYGYDALAFDFAEQDGKTIRYLREVKLYETSDVLWGANSATLASKALLTAVMERRGLTKPELEKVQGVFGQLDTVLGGTELTTELKAGRVLSAKNASLVKDAINALQAVLDAADGDDTAKAVAPAHDVKDNLELAAAPPDGHASTSLIDSLKSLDNLVAEQELLRDLRAFGRTLERGA